MAPKPVQQQSFTTINEPIKLTKKQNEILTMVCDLYEMEVGEYIKDALIESLKEEITDGDFCGLLASKLDENKKEDKSKTGDKAISHEVSVIQDWIKNWGFLTSILISIILPITISLGLITLSDLEKYTVLKK